VKRLAAIDTLLAELGRRIFTSTGHTVPLRYRAAGHDDRAEVLVEDRTTWRPVTPDLVWGEPDGYFWFAGGLTIPDSLSGAALHLRIAAQFGTVMGRSDPQCLVRIDGRIVQGADANHRTVPLTDSATTGQTHDIMIEAGTIEDRRQLGFAVEVLRHDALAERLYYDLRVPVDVARLLPPDDARRHAILHHAEAALAVIDLRPGEARFHASLRAALPHADAIYALADADAMPRVVATGHTHIDVAWLWRVRETRQKMARSMATALGLMEAYPAYRFMYNQCILLDYLAQDYPDIMARIKDRVAAGQFEIEGALWLEPDVNIASGEALVRHILHGVRFHEQTFGVRPRILWLPDTFGYSAALPQLMAQAGLDTFVTHKMSWNDTNRMPFDTFHWQGIDGSRVPAWFLTSQRANSAAFRTTYNPELTPDFVIGTWQRYSQKHLSDEVFMVYGYGDGGGGPTREMLENLTRLARGIPGCPKVTSEPMRAFFDRLLARMAATPDNFPTWVGELYFEYHRGTLTSVARNKAQNRRAEEMLRQIETLAALAHLQAGHAYPRAALWDLWQIVLLNQFHDILPGSSIGAVYDDSDRDYARFFAQATALRADLAARIAPQGARVAINLTGHARGGLVASDDAQAQAIEAADGSRARVIRLAPVPPLGQAPLVPTAPKGRLSVGPDHLSNDRIALRFDAQGRITAIEDRASGRNLLPPGARANRLQAFRDWPEKFDAWDIDRSFEGQVWEIDDLRAVRVTEAGPLRAAIRFEWAYERSRIVQVVSLEADARQIEVDCRIDWHEQHTLLKTAFPLAVSTTEVRAEIQFGHVRRPTHANTSWDEARYECSMHRWVDLAEPGFGVALLNDCKYGYDAKGSTIRLTLLRSPTYPWPQADQGEHRLRYAILPHDGDIGAVVQAAEAFNLPLLAADGGAMGAEPVPPLSVEGAGIVLETVKLAEDDDALILRLWESRGAHGTARITLPPGATAAATTDLLERDPIPLPIIDGNLTLAFAPFQIRTVKVT